MQTRVSVIIPALNEEARIATAIDSARRADALEVIVADGGSSDETVPVAREHGAEIVSGATMRSRQLNAGAAAARGDILLFLHADTRLPDDAMRAVTAALAAGHTFGGFRVKFAEDDVRLRVAETMINLRTSFTRCPWGDQAQFIRREMFLEQRGYREIPLMEDYEMAIRMKRVGRTAILPLHVITSGRRFLTKGVLRTAAINWQIVARFRSGASPEELALLYRK
jgi:rSAM/selenodomain-associated transferase 2